MKERVQIELLPLGRVLQVERGESLQEILFPHGVEFPCGGRGRCKGCKIKLLSGTLPVTDADESCLTLSERAAGWRLACRAVPEADLRIELAQWEAPILSDNTIFPFQPRPGLGVAIDLGTTTIVAQLLDLQTGNVLAVRSSLNEQARHGADIMSRVEYAVASEGQAVLEKLIRSQIGQLVEELLANTQQHGPAFSPLESIMIVGNTVMHHLFCGISVEPLSRYPFVAEQDGLQTFSATTLGWDLPADPKIHFLPCLGGFVGSDLLAGILATKLNETEALALLIDLGTNGEIVLGNRQRLLCAATAAGPAFEGARISMGMRAATGAISDVHIENGQLQCHVLGKTTPRGICGSGLVDAVAMGLELGSIRPNGRLSQGESLDLAHPVKLTQHDIRELQLAKGAIAAGVKLLLQEWGATESQIHHVYLAGAFGNYINQNNARRIGLLKFPPEKILPVGNTALLGAKLALFNLPHADPSYPGLRAAAKHVSLHEVKGFEDVYAEEMGFP